MKKSLIFLCVLFICTLINAQSDIQTIDVESKTKESVWRSPMGVSMFLGYQNASMGKEYNDDITSKSLNGFILNMNCDLPIWKPIGIEIQFDWLCMSFAKGTYRIQDPYYYDADVTKNMFNINIGLMPSCWVMLGKNSAVHFVTGPKLIITTLNKIVEDNKGHGEHYVLDLKHSDKNPDGYNCLNVAWGFGLGINYKHIGIKFMYEIEMVGRLAGMNNSDSNNPRFKYLSVGLYIPLYLQFGDYIKKTDNIKKVDEIRFKDLMMMK